MLTNTGHAERTDILHFSSQRHARGIDTLVIAVRQRKDSGVVLTNGHIHHVAGGCGKIELPVNIFRLGPSAAIMFAGVGLGALIAIGGIYHRRFIPVVAQSLDGPRSWSRRRRCKYRSSRRPQCRWRPSSLRHRSRCGSALPLMTSWPQVASMRSDEVSYIAPMRLHSYDCGYGYRSLPPPPPELVVLLVHRGGGAGAGGTNRGILAALVGDSDLLIADVLDVGVPWSQR